jgi:hypothetical protein
MGLRPGQRPTQADEKRVLFSNYCPGKRRPPLCHFDRSVPGFPTSRSWQRPRVRFSSKGNRMILINATALYRKSGERSGEICGPFLEMFFDRAQRSGGTCDSAALPWECFSIELDTVDAEEPLRPAPPSSPEMKHARLLCPQRLKSIEFYRILQKTELQTWHPAQSGRG